jgi:hypothetical protein
MGYLPAQMRVTGITVPRRVKAYTESMDFLMWRVGR